MSTHRTNSEERGKRNEIETEEERGEEEKEDREEYRAVTSEYAEDK